MDPLDAWFPYASYRPKQREMLQRAAQVARDGGILMIEAPTGSGKSSLAAALLAGRGGRRVLVAVRTVSQLNTFIRELELIRKKQPGLKYAYLIGKRGMCRLPGEGDVYRRCEGVKAFSTTLMRERAEKGSQNPAKDPFVLQQIRRMDPAKPVICPYFIRSRAFSRDEPGGLRMVPSAALRAVADRISSRLVRPASLPEVCGDLCPYEAMFLAAHSADVVILNYHHLFDESIREQLYIQLGSGPGDIILLLDEAHNCGEAMQSVQSVELDEDSLSQASIELGGLRRTQKTADGIIGILPRISEFMDGLRYSDEREDWFDPAIFDRMVVRGSLYRDMDGIVEDLLVISEKIRERGIRAGEYRETAVERLTAFLLRIAQAGTDPSFLTVYRKDDERVVLEIRNIDPGAKLQDLAGGHHAAVLISGSLSPVESYRKFYFGDLPVGTCTLPNTFPRENRLLLCAGDVTTAFSRRQDRENRERIKRYILSFASLPGNLAVYFPSYQILEEYSSACLPHIRRKEVFVEPRDAKDAGNALKAFLALPESGHSGILFAVCGGKWSEGLDYRGEMLSGAMVVGLPLAPFNAVRKMIISYFRKKFGEEGEFISYTLPALNRAQQALGRVLRTPEDRGVLVLAENRFLEPKVRLRLPAWIRDEAGVVSADDFGEAIARWK